MIDLLPSKIVKQLEKSLSEKRFRHSLGVLETAFQLADSWKNHPIDRKLLAWASLFHDCAKELSKDERIRVAQENSCRWGRELLEYNKLNHAPLSANMLHRQYGIDDRDTLMAVAYHPTGHPGLTPIGWAVYVADALEPNRTYLQEREAWLEKACKNPLKGLRLITDLRIQFVKQKNKPLHPLALDFKRYLESLKSL